MIPREKLLQAESDSQIELGTVSRQYVVRRCGPGRRETLNVPAANGDTLFHELRSAAISGSTLSLAEKVNSPVYLKTGDLFQDPI